MTDKEPIKWDDETKWAYEKCKQVEEPKEQIIIDGGDILKEQQENKKINRNCKYYHPNNKCGLKAWCMLNARKCNVNADYCQLKLRKQLARKTQECEKLSILAQEESARNAYIEYELNDKLKQKTQECEQLKEDFHDMNEQLKDYKELHEKLIDQNASLQKQVEDMLEWQKTVVRLFDRTCRCQSLDEKTAICKENGKECISIVGCRDCYRKALEEIEDFTKKHCDFWCSGNRVLDIINKAKREGK